MMQLLRAILPWIPVVLAFALIVFLGVALTTWGAVGIIQDLPKGRNPC